MLRFFLKEVGFVGGFHKWTSRFYYFFCAYPACIVMNLSFALVIYTSLEIWTFHDTEIHYHELLYCTIFSFNKCYYLFLSHLFYTIIFINAILTSILLSSSKNWYLIDLPTTLFIFSFITFCFYYFTLPSLVYSVPLLLLLFVAFLGFCSCY